MSVQEMTAPAAEMISKAAAPDFPGRFREIVSDPLNLFIERVPLAGAVQDGRVCLHNGIWVPLSGPGSYYGDFSNILVINRGVHEPLEEYVFQELLARLPAAPAMVELGAYWGHYSMWLKHARPAAQVCMVEPERGNLNVGRKNFQFNALDGEFILAFVGKGQFELDHFISSRQIHHLDILHADIQGFECEMLAGARQALVQKIPDYVFISTHSQQLHLDVLAQLQALHYRVEVSSDPDFESTSCDGFLFASSPRKEPVLPDFSPLGRQQIYASSPPELLQYLTTLAHRKR